LRNPSVGVTSISAAIRLLSPAFRARSKATAVLFVAPSSTQGTSGRTLCRNRYVLHRDGMIDIPADYTYAPPVTRDNDVAMAGEMMSRQPEASITPRQARGRPESQSPLRYRRSVQYSQQVQLPKDTTESLVSRISRLTRLRAGDLCRLADVCAAG
jgi:hypothetical protein